MGLADKFNELKDMVTGAVEGVKEQAGGLLGQAQDSDLADQAGEAAQTAEETAQNATDTAQDAGDQAQGSVDDLKDKFGL